MSSVYSWGMFIIGISMSVNILMPLGRGEDGQLGVGETTDQFSPIRIDALEGKAILQIACGSGHTVVLTGKFSILYLLAVGYIVFRGT